MGKRGTSGAPARVGRRALMGWGVGAGVGIGAATTGASRVAHADDLVSPPLQASLLSRVAGYDRNFAARALDKAKMLLVAKPHDRESARVVREMKAALSDLPAIGGLPHDEEVTTYKDAATVARTCTSHRISIVYFGPGFAEEIPSIRVALTSLDLLSVGAVPDYVVQGIVLGFDSVSGKPRLVLNLGQARAQHVNFAARILKLMTIYE
jgi:hypothetical protein